MRSSPLCLSFVLVGLIACSETPTDPTDHTSEEQITAPRDARLAFVSTRDGSPQIYVANADGVVARLVSGERPAWSPDGRRIAFHRTGRGVYVMNADGSNVQRIAEGLRPSWSPDGGRIVFTGGTDPGIFVVDADGSGLTQLLAGDYAAPPGSEGGEHCACSPTWSPDGRHIAFVVQNYVEVWQIHIMNADGADPHALAAPGGMRSYEADPAWSPDGSRLAFEGLDGHILGVDTEGVVQVLIDTQAFGGRPGWSPDGRSVIFARGVEGPVTDKRIYAVSLETGFERQVVSEAASPAQRPYDDYDATWRPTQGGDRSGVPVPTGRMAFGLCFEWERDVSLQDVCNRGGITVLDPDGSEEMFANGEPRPYIPTDPAWSPDGSKIGFAGFQHCDPADAGSCSSEIHVMGADGSAVARLTNSMGASAAEPNWTPDGKRLAYVVTTYDRAGTSTPRLRVMNADGSGTATLGDLVGFSPAWSPDGTQLAFSAGDDGPSRGIYVTDADGSNPRRLTREPEARDSRPNWSPDGRRIAFTRDWTHPDGSGSCQIFVMDADGSSPLQLTEDSFCAHNPAWSRDGATIAYNGTEGPDSHGIMLMNADGTGARLIRPTEGWPSRVTWAPLP